MVTTTGNITNLTKPGLNQVGMKGTDAKNIKIKMQKNASSKTNKK